MRITWLGAILPVSAKKKKTKMTTGAMTSRSSALDRFLLWMPDIVPRMNGALRCGVLEGREVDRDATPFGCG
jgi:hypothetical protein